MCIRDRDEIIESVASNNHNILKQVSGIGEKTAKLILLQLQGQLDNIPHKTNNLDLDTQIEATQAVQALGYPPDQIKKIIDQASSSKDSISSGITFEIGEKVKVCDGPFASFTGMVEEVNEEKSRIKVSVSIFGRPTPVDLGFNEVEKN